MHNTFKNKTKLGSENYVLGGRLHVLGNGTDTHTKVPKRSSGIDTSRLRTSLPSPLPSLVLFLKVLCIVMMVILLGY